MRYINVALKKMVLMIIVDEHYNNLLDKISINYLKVACFVFIKLIIWKFPKMAISRRNNTK